MAYLVDNMEVPEPATFSRTGSLEMEEDHYAVVHAPSTSSATSNHGNGNGHQGARRKDANKPDSYVSFSSPGSGRVGYDSESSDIPNSPQVDIHMEIPHHLEMQSVYQVYYSSMETEETVKCIVTSVLFFALIALVLIFSFTQNPMMS